jgi:hypothetical protein
MKIKAFDKYQNLPIEIDFSIDDEVNVDTYNSTH